MSGETLLPAIRSHVGDWSYYVTTLSFEAVSRLVKEPDEIHERKRLADWIQREAIESHADAIAKYIEHTPQRFLGSLIIGVYDGRPDWAPLDLNFSLDPLRSTADQREKIKGKLGLLRLSGGEKLFAIDGQHRVAGIKRALREITEGSAVRDEEVSAIFVGHDASSEAGKQRTRRLFTTVNKKARRVSQAAIIALDEDNGFAVVTRRLIDEHPLFADEAKSIAFTGSAAIPPTDQDAITSVVGLFEIVRDLHSPSGRARFGSTRPSDRHLDRHFGRCSSYLDHLVESCPEYKAVFVARTGKAGDFRTPGSNHLLFRPAGQRAFARAVELQVARGTLLEEGISNLLAVNLDLETADWQHILWDPIKGTMITKYALLAETQLLRLAGLAARSAANASKLDTFLAAKQGI